MYVSVKFLLCNRQSNVKNYPDPALEKAHTGMAVHTFNLRGCRGRQTSVSSKPVRAT